MMARSRYDDLHEHYQAILTAKAGTRYERLAAVVFAALDRNSVVIHDLKVFGSDTGVKHQIDVQIEKDGRSRRILIECKDFDVSGDPAGLAVVRDFWGVVDDVHPHEAWVITCNRFTDEAKQYAKGKGVKLATLRVFANSDWEGRLHTIVTNFVFRNPHVDRINLAVQTVNDGDEERILEGLTANSPFGFAFECANDKSQIYDGNTVRSLSEIVVQLTSTPTKATHVEQLVEGKLCDGWISLDGGTRYDIKGFSVTIPVTEIAIRMTIAAADGAAKLLLVDGDGLDFVLWDTALEAYTIDDEGRVHLASEDVQKRLITTIETVSTQ